MESVKTFFMWCTVINYAFLLFWLLFSKFGRDWHYELTSRFFGVTGEQYDRVNFYAFALFKILIMFFNLVPFIALSIISR